MRSNNSNSKSNGGIGFCGLLTIVFIVLKLVWVIEWSWLWVLAPLWGSFAILAVAAIVLFSINLVCERRTKRRK